MNLNLDGRVVAVTGAFGILGMAVAEEIVRQGGRVAMIDRAAEPAGVLPAILADALLLGNIDLTSYESAQKAIGQIVSELGALDALVNIAGGFRWETLADGDLSSWDFLYAINLRTAATASKAALGALLESSTGRIVNIGAGAALKSGMGMGAYAASKAGVARLTESLSEELKDKGVTVNAVLPSIIDTPQNRSDMPDAEFDRWVKPSDLAAVIAFLLSPQASAVTGALIPVSGRV
ncbi:SDR family NAD(P)-dependent oxidoreductase [Pseudomonas sp. JAI120]|uniref:SDR family NAD(P)-dependent oxidoreductase n=1 Tax=Pseudomonas sp. JAI120 TaxID=2723063 RepID=UPI0030EB18C6